MQDQSRTPVQTAACDTARHGLCRGTVFSLTSAHLSDCACPCHGERPASGPAPLVVLGYVRLAVAIVGGS
jgi:hypothetical protein